MSALKKPFVPSPLVVLSLVVFLSTLNWYNFSAIFPVLQVEWGITSRQGGMLMGIVQVGYAFSVVIFGYISDKIGARRVLLYGCLIAGITGILFATMAAGFASGFILRFAAGLGVGALYVPSMVYLIQVYPPQRRGYALGILTGALSLAIGATYLFSGIAITLFSWRQSVILTSAPAFLGCLLIKYRLPELQPPAPENGVSTPITWKAFRRQLSGSVFWLIILGYLGHSWELIALRGWIGPYFVHCLLLKGSNLKQATALGGAMAAAGNLTNFFATVAGGWISDRLGYLRTAAVFTVFGGLLSFIFGHLFFLPFYVLAGVGMIYLFLVIADSAIYKAMLTEAISPGLSGLWLGFQSAIGFGIPVIPYFLFGATLDTTGSWGAAFSVLGVGAVGTLVSLIMLIRFGRNCRREIER